MLNLKHLYYFHVFAQELSTTRAAKRLGITLPALSNQLKQLEGFLGVALVQRTSGKVAITEPGEMVLHYADRMFSAYDDLKSTLAHSRKAGGTRFRVGICQNIGAQFTFDLLSLIVKRHISISQKTQITFDSSEKILGDFKKDLFDLVIGAFPSVHGDRKKWVSQTLSFPVRLFSPHSLMEGVEAEERPRALSDLTQIIELANSKKISLVLPAHPSVLRDETEKFLRNSKVPPAKTMESNNTSAIVQLIDRGMAMGFVPSPCLLDFKSADTLSVLGPPGGYWAHGVSILIQKGEGRSMTKVSPLAEIFSPG
jgi:DNA-binding transcriptional LysR family regulator